MSDYTPTTEEVRETYFITGYKTTPEQFDRWLAEVKAEAWDEGHRAGENYGRNCEALRRGYIYGFVNVYNPYREETE